MWHWTECDTAVLKRKKKAKFGVILFVTYHHVLQKGDFRIYKW